MTTVPWWVRLPSRLLEDEQELRRLYEQDAKIIVSHRWSRTDSGEPSVLVRIKVGSLEWDLEVRFPSNYPEGCPAVRPVPDTLRISDHQYLKSGILCLELGPDNWHPKYSVASLVNSAWKLFALETIRVLDPSDALDIPSRHEASLPERIAGSKGVFLRSLEFDERLQRAEPLQEFEIVWFDDQRFRVVPVSLPKGDKLTLPTALANGIRYPGLVVQLTGDVTKGVPTDPQEFRDFVTPFLSSAPDRDAKVFVLRWPDREVRAYMHFASTILPLTDMPLLDDSVRTPDTLGTRLADLRVGIVGLGSLGSKVAVSLARTGIRRFVLVDGDVMKAENVRRHAGSYREVGMMKVEAAEQLLLEVSPTEVEVKTYSVGLGAPTQPEFHARLTERLAGCDLLVDATADPEAFLHLAGLASDHRRPLVWGEVFAGGLGGLVASAHPDRTPCPRCVRMAFQAVTADWPPAPHRAAPLVPYGTDDDAPVVATDADVSYIAAAITRRIFDLVQAAPSLAAVVLLGVQRGWIFESAPQNVPVPVRRDDCSCERCWTPEEAAPSDAEAEADKLFEKPAHAHDSSAA